LALGSYGADIIECRANIIERYVLDTKMLDTREVDNYYSWV
jgi:hypothetical protein